jgi:hypothetical protein
MKPHSETKPCIDCGIPITTLPTTLDFSGTKRTLPAPDICGDCGSERQAEQQRQQRVEKLDAAWREIAPPIYRQSDPTRFPEPLQNALAAFDPASRTGIGIRGDSGLCKTRAAFLLLKTAHYAGHKTIATRADTIARIAANQWDDRPDPTQVSCIRGTPTIGQTNQKKLADLASCEWLLIDDIGKQVNTPRSEAELWSILEQRTSNNLPTIWTLNMSAEQLGRYHSKDRSTPILRRLVEFSDVIILE